MSKFILMNVTLFHAKLFVNTYTALTLPFYALYQKPWRKIKLSKLVRTTMTIDNNGHPVWIRKGPPMQSPYMKYNTFVEAFSKMDRLRRSIGVRDVIEEQVNYDEEGKLFVMLFV